MAGALVCLGEGVTQSGVEYIVWQRGLRILHYCHLGSNSQYWSNCQPNSKSNSPKWSPSLKYCVSSLADTILLGHSQWHIVFLCALLWGFIISTSTTVCWVIYYQLVIFLRWHILKWSLLFHRSNYNCSSEVCKDASDLIDISIYTEGILMKYCSFALNKYARH